MGYPSKKYPEQLKAWGLKAGTIDIRTVFCGKKRCSRCPHGWYAYHKHQLYGRIKRQYLGACDIRGFPIIEKQYPDETTVL